MFSSDPEQPKHGKKKNFLNFYNNDNILLYNTTVEAISKYLLLYEGLDFSHIL